MERQDQDGHSASQKNTPYLVPNDVVCQKSCQISPGSRGGYCKSPEHFFMQVKEGDTCEERCTSQETEDRVQSCLHVEQLSPDDGDDQGVSKYDIAGK